MTNAAAERATIRGTRPRLLRPAMLADAIRSAGPALLFGLRLWVSACLALYVAFWLELDNPSWAGTTAALVCQPHLGASLRKGWYRLIGTFIGALAAVALAGYFPQERAAFFIGFTGWAAACALVATVLRNFAAYAAALAGFTSAVIVGDDLGATGGLHGQVFALAVTRATEISIGIVAAGIVLAGTDFGAARRRLATLLAPLVAETAAAFATVLAQARPNFRETQDRRRDLARRVIALDPIIDEAKGESSQLRYHSPVLASAVEGLLTALAAWRIVDVHVAKLPAEEAHRTTAFLLHSLPKGLRPDRCGEASAWLADPIGIGRSCRAAAARRLLDFSTPIPSLRLVADQTARLLTGLADALVGIALLVGQQSPPATRRGHGLVVPDWAPPLLNGARAFIAIGAVELFWIETAWPNGASALVFTAFTVLVYAPMADNAFTAARGFTTGCILAAAVAAVMNFSILPNLETFPAFALALGLYLVPVGALMASFRDSAAFVAMASMFIPILAPTNQMSYDPERFSNAALALVVGCGIGALSFLLLPSLSPAVRTRRLLDLTLRDLRRVATHRALWNAEEWEARVLGRLIAFPDEARAVQRAQLLAAMAIGAEIVALRPLRDDPGCAAILDAALAAIGDGRCGLALTRLTVLDERLASRAAAADSPRMLRVRASILTIADALEEHMSYFAAGACG
jgi:uncharacterized membrane protein YccC